MMDIEEGVMRSISVGVPSGVVKMTLWAGTEDEERFPVKSLKRGKPYVMAYGVKYELTEEEARFARNLAGLVPLRA